jgi:para-nitrobenzyl esterase
MPTATRVGGIYPIVLAAAGLAALAHLSGCKAEKAAPSAPLEETRRSIAQGDVVGTRGRYGDYAWLGIPFAAPPVGDLRWRAPQPPQPWNGDYLATASGSPCVQIASPFAGVVDLEPGTPAGNEDCLYLNVYAPSAPSDEPLPVLFWIHGGGNVIGHAGFYDGGNLAVTENVVVVTTQYRLGPLGWFRDVALRQGATPEERSGNFGTLDLIRALQWVRDNIRAFGGDPQRVTIFGESAGGRNVISLLLSPPARGLFHGAIAQSGGTGILTPAEAENGVDADIPGLPSSSTEALLAMFESDGLAKDRDAAKLYLRSQSPSEIEAYLRSKSAYDLLQPYHADVGEGLIRVANVFGDGVVIEAGDALENLAAGRAAPVPAVFGTNRDEQKIFMFADPRWTKRVLGILPRPRDIELYNATADTLSRIWAVRGALEPAAARHQAMVAPSYVYRWDWDEEPTVLGTDLSQMIGAAHGLEIPFVFGHFYLGPEGEKIFDETSAPGRIALSRAMMSYWAQFARTGEPGRGSAGDLPTWQRWGPGEEVGKALVFDTVGDGGIRMESEMPTREEVYAELESDARIGTTERRCRVYATLKEWTREIDDQRYQELGCTGS